MTETAGNDAGHRRRVVITGTGVVTSLGHDTQTLWHNVKAGASGVGPITRFDASALDTRIAGEVKDFDAEQYMDLF